MRYGLSRIILGLCLIMVSALLCTAPVSADVSGYGYYVIHTNIDYASVYFDGSYMGLTSGGKLSVPFESGAVAPKTLLVEKSGYYSATQPITTTPAIDSTVDLYVSLSPTAAPTATTASGALKITSTPSGAQIYINNIYQGIAPLRVPDLRPGTYMVEAVLESYDPVSKTVQVYAGEDAYATLTLASAGTLTVTSDPSGAFVSVNSETKGRTPLTITGLESREYSVIVSMNGYYNWKETVSLSSGEGEYIEAVLKPVDETQILVSSVPDGAQVYLDGVYQGETMKSQPLPVRGMAPGQHTLTLRHSGYQDYTKTISVVEGAALSVYADLSSPPASEIVWPVASGTGVLIVTSTPEGADIFLNQEATGYVTPTTIAGLTAGQYTVTLKKVGYADSLPTAVDVLEDSSPTQLTVSLAEDAVPEGIGANTLTGIFLLILICVGGGVLIMKLRQKRG